MDDPTSHQGMACDGNGYLVIQLDIILSYLRSRIGQMVSAQSKMILLQFELTVESEFVTRLVVLHLGVYRIINR